MHDVCTRTSIRSVAAVVGVSAGRTATRAINEPISPGGSQLLRANRLYCVFHSLHISCCARQQQGPCPVLGRQTVAPDTYQPMITNRSRIDLWPFKRLWRLGHNDLLGVVEATVPRARAVVAIDTYSCSGKTFYGRLSGCACLQPISVQDMK